MPTIAFMNQKGGVGKTTTALNLAVQSAIKSKTLMVDADMQANLTKQFVDPNDAMKELFSGKEVEPVTVGKKLDLIPSSINLAGIENIIINEIGGQFILKKALKAYDNKGYKNIFIDCPPSISLVTINALAAADYVLIPVRASMFSVDGIEKMLEFVFKVRENYNEDLVILGILLTQLDQRDKTINRSIREELGKIGLEKHLLNTVIRRNIDVEKSQFSRMPLLDFNRKSKAAADYASLGYELERKIKSLQ